MLQLRVMEVVVTTGAIRYAKLQSVVITYKPTPNFLQPDALPVTQPTVSKYCVHVCVCVCQQIQYADLDFINSTASEIRSIERSALPVRSGGNDSTEYDEVDAIKTQALISAITSREIDAIVPPSDDC